MKLKLKDAIYTKRFFQNKTKANELKIIKTQLSRLIEISRNKVLLVKEKEIKKFLIPTNRKLSDK